MTGLSQVNFDVQGLGDDEEEQLNKEDAERERELHELLTNELPDDLLDDDNISFTSPHHSGSTNDHETHDFVSDQSSERQHSNKTEDVHMVGSSHIQPGYPQMNKISMLLTRRGEEFIQRFTTSPPPDSPYHPQSSTSHLHPSAESLPRGYHEGSYGYMQGQGGFTKDNDEHQRRYTYHAGDDPVVSDGDEYYGGYEDAGYYGVTGYPEHDENFNQVVYTKPENLPNLLQNVTDTGSDMIDDFKVHYKRGENLQVTESQHEAIQNEALLGHTSVSPSTVELAQLQILHRARKRKLEEVTNELQRKEKDYERQIRVLNHQLALMKGERDGMASSLQHAQEIATGRKQEMDELEEKVQNSELEKERMHNERNEIESELESAKKTIESLHQQLMELEKSESLSRAREQHENVVMATKKRYDEDIARLKQKLDDVNNSLTWKDEESKRLHDELVEARKESDRVRLDRAETVNRLTKSLEQSQKQNEELLNSGSTQEISQLQRQLGLTQHEKEDLEEHYKAMESDLADMKEQLRIYESMSKLGFTSDANDGVRRNLEADQWRTPSQTTLLESKFSTEEALVGLQKELQHSLASNRTKREEIQQLRVQFDEVKKHLVAKENEIERMGLLVRKQEIRVLEQEKKISELEDLNRNPEEREKKKDDEIQNLCALVEEQGVKLEECERHEREMENMNVQLKTQISELIRDHDSARQSSVEQCRQSCLEFHDQAMSKMKQQLASEHEKELAKLRHELQTKTTALDEVKESYVALSEESRWIETQTRERCEKETSEKMKEEKIKWDEAKTCELLALRQTLATESEKTVERERASWRENEELRIKNNVETELAIAKIDWNKDQQKHRDEAIENALSMAEREWLAKYGKPGQEEEWEARINSLKNDWEETKTREFDQRLEELRTKLMQEQVENMNAARQEWGKLKAVEIEREIEKSRRNWEEELAKIVDEAELSAVKKAKIEWLKGQESREKIFKEKEESLSEALTAAKAEWEREKDLEIPNIIAREKQKWLGDVEEAKQQAIDRAVSLAEEKWNNEHTNRVNSAVKEALDLAEAAWRKEKDSAIESAVTKSLHSAKETWNENKAKEMEQILSNAKKQWLTELNLNKQELNTSPRSRKSIGSSEDVNKTFSYLEAQYSTNLKEFRETELKRVLEEHQKNLLDTVEELKTKYETKLKEEETKHLAELDNVSRKSQEEREIELKELETGYQNKLENIVEEIEGKWREKKAALEEEWTEKFAKQQEQLEASYREKYQNEREGLGRQMREKYEKGVEHARKKLEYQFKEKLQISLERARHDWEAEQEEERIAVEEQHLEKLEKERERLKNEIQRENEERIFQIENEKLLKTKHLEEQLKNEKERYKTDIENLQNELHDLKQSQRECSETLVRKEEDRNHEASQTDLIHDQPWVSMTEISDDSPNFEKLNELRRQYLATTAQLKEDLMKHAIETRNNAAKAIRSEVMKERHSTANQLRKYYLECLKQILDEDKEAYKNNLPTRSNEDKIKIMEERLILPAEKNETTKSHDSTLTNVSSLPEAEPYPIRTRGRNVSPSNTYRPDKGSPVRRDVIKTSSRPPRGRTRDTQHKDKNIGLHSDREEFGSIRKGISISTESMDSNLSLQLDLPPVIDLLGQSSSDNSRGAESEMSVNSGGTFENVENYTKPSEASHHRAEHFKSERTANREQFHRASTHFNERETHSRRRATHENVQDTHGKIRDVRLNKWDGDGSDRHLNKRSTNEKMQNTRSLKHDAHSPKRETHSPKRETQTSSKGVSRPVIKTGNSKKTTSSLRRSVADVLPSKPLSPASNSPGTFSYTMHSQRTNK
ncbi:centrosomal protein of 152 kDa-like [Dendronephthya gigantea]|uniref:centrosomal protein of 152 kDa-like n=1 Tax=Dendronephthya gigantea TaxID=151771 RepID=UPI00106B5156|nr:centrosomal protein of 152 kDa-like [Dendronephthya gigantea]